MWQREVTWLDLDEPLTRERLPEALQSSLKTQMTLTEVTKHLHTLDELLDGSRDDDSNWEGFLYWAQRLLELESFDSEERDYKLAAAAILAEARHMLSAGEDWLNPLTRALHGDNNLVDWRARDTFLLWCQADPGEAANAVAALWKDDDATEGALDAFAAL